MIFVFDDFELDAERLELRRAGQLVKADRLVLRVLAVLVQNAGQLVTKDELVDAVWEGRAVADNVLTVSMARLRKTLGHARGVRELVVTEYGRGYRFVSEVQARHASSSASASGSASAPRPAASAPPPAASLAARLHPFVGREHVLERLRHAQQQASAGRGRVCVLMGEAGIGKTRAAEMLEREIQESNQANPATNTVGSVRVAWGYCREGGNTPPLAPWTKALHGLTRDARGAEPVVTRSVEGMLQALLDLTKTSPAVIVLDDLHRADAASLELLSLLVDEIARTQLLVVATLRNERGRRALRFGTHLPYVLGHRNCERIQLERLQEKDVAAYVRALVGGAQAGGAQAAEALARTVYEKSEGNPFFMLELARPLETLRDESISPDALTLPDSALDLIRQHIALLDHETREVLQDAAVIGHSFELPLLARALGRDPSALMPSLDDAIASDAVVAAPGSLTAFAFSHELLRAVLYAANEPAALRRKHLRIAEALEARVAGGEAVAPSELAYHFRAALPDCDPRKVVEHCRAAAGAAAEVLASLDVVRYLRHALEAIELIPNASPRLRMRTLFMVALFARSHAPDEHVRALRETVQLARQLGDGAVLVHAARMRMHLPGFVPTPGATEALEQALPLLEPHDPGSRAVALATLACSMPAASDITRSEALIAQAVALAQQVGSPEVLHPVLRCELYLHGGLHGGPNGGPNEQRAETLRTLDRIAQQHWPVAPVLPVELAMHRASTALQHGDLATSNAELVRALASCRKLTGGEMLWHCERFAALRRIDAGELEQGLAELDALHVRAAQRSLVNTKALCATDRAIVRGELLHKPVSLDSLRAALEPQACDPPSIWALKTHALASGGLIGEARSALRIVAPAELVKLPWDTEYLATLGHLARAAALLDARDYAEPLLELLSPHAQLFAASNASASGGAVPQVMGLLANTLEQTQLALEYVETGLRMNEQAGLVTRANEARLCLQRWS